jgi:predicted peroxiredoxin
MAGTFCVTIAHCRTDGDKATVGFVVANAALGSEKDTLVFLSTDGVYCAVKGEAEKIDAGPPFAPLQELIDKFVAAGGKIFVCTPCMKKREIKEDQLIKGATPAGGAALVEWLAKGSPCVCY